MKFQVSWSINQLEQRSTTTLTTTMTSSSNASMIATLMAGMDVSSLTEKGVSAETLAKTIAQLTQATEEKKSGGGTGRKDRVRKEIPAGERCMARTWGQASKGNLGMGPQCSSKKCGGDYCKMHAKLAAASEEPCQMVNGKKFGLFCGRIDQPLQGKDSNGKWQILWLCPTVVKQIDADKEAGSFELGENELAHKTKSSGPKKPRVKKEKAAKKEKAPKAPRGKNAYMFYLESRRAAINAEILAAGTAEGASQDAKDKLTKTGKVKVSEVTKVAGAEWKALDADAKKPFEAQSAADKAAKQEAFISAQLVEKAAGIAVADHDKSVLKAICEPASPPVAPVSEDEADEANATALALIAQLKGDDEADSETEEDEDGENEAWSYTLTGEHESLCEDGSAVVIPFDSKHYVVPYSWYEGADEETVSDEAAVKKVSVGMLTNPKPPTGDGDIEGDFVVKA